MTTTTTIALADAATSIDALIAALKDASAYNGVSRFKAADLRVYAAKVATVRNAGNVEQLTAKNIDDVHAFVVAETDRVAAERLEAERASAEQPPVAPSVEIVGGGLSGGVANEIAAEVTAEVQAAIDLLSSLGYTVRASKAKASAPTAPKATDGARARFEAIIEHGVKADDGSIVATADVLRAAGCPDSWCKYAALFAPSGNAYATAIALGFTPRLRTVDGQKALVLVPVQA